MSECVCVLYVNIMIRGLLLFFSFLYGWSWELGLEIPSLRVSFITSTHHYLTGVPPIQFPL